MPSRETHLQSLVDDDLIQEFLIEIERLSRISNSLNEQNQEMFPIDIRSELQRIGETFFLQFFPEKIQDKMRGMHRGTLFFHTDQHLRNIPWELLHDGRKFLAERYFIGRDIAGYWKDVQRPEQERLRVLIVADPKEDLEWARREGEGLFEALNAEFSADRMAVQLLSGSRITKLNLLNAIKDKDIIHYSGHLHYSKETRESGWSLAGGKVLRAREIEKAGFAPNLVFSNSCMSSAALAENQGVKEESFANQFSDLAGAFLSANIGNYIGTNWEIKDNSNTFDFAMNFYRAIFEARSVGEALFEARKYAIREYSKNDLTWANYVLHGNPQSGIYRPSGRATFDASRNQITARRIIESYPLPIAAAYKDFQDRSSSGAASTQCLEALIDVFVQSILLVGSVILADSKRLNLNTDDEALKHNLKLWDWIEVIFTNLRGIHNLQMEPATPGIVEFMFVHREQLKKLNDWRVLYESGKMSTEMIEIHLVTFQYTADNFLSDLAGLARHKFLYIYPNAEDVKVLQLVDLADNAPIPAEIRGIPDSEMEQHKGKIIFYNYHRQIILPLDDFVQYEPDGKVMSFRTHFVDLNVAAE